MALSTGDQRVLEEIARGVAQDDPAYSARLSAFGGYEVSALGMPSRWVTLPVAALAAVLALAVFLVPALSADPGPARNASGIPHFGHR